MDKVAKRRKEGQEITIILMEAIKPRISEISYLDESEKLHMTTEILVNLIGNCIFSSIIEGAPLDIYQDFKEDTLSYVNEWFTRAIDIKAKKRLMLNKGACND